MFDKQGSQGSPSTPHVTIGARELIESAPDLIFCCDTDGRFQWLNSAVEIHLGMRTADLLGGSFLSIVAEGERRALTHYYVDQHRSANEVTTRHVTLISKDGAETQFLARVRRVERPDGEVIFVGCASPVPNGGGIPGAHGDYAGPYAGARPAPVPLPLSSTDEWAGGNAAVGAGVISAPSSSVQAASGSPAELTARLNEARSEAELKADFLETMSEEIRTPINGILGMSQLLLETELDADQRSFIEVIQSSSRSLLNLVNDTLEFSQIEKDACDIQAIDFDLRHTVDEVATLVAPLANEKGLGFDCRTHHAAPSLLRGDPARIRQVLCNLATTALKMTTEGQVSINVERITEDDERVSLKFNVHDTGLVLDTPDVAQVFDAWTRPDRVAARRQGGASLALAIAREIVANMDGEVGVSSEAGKGTRFWFRMPLRKQGATREATTLSPSVQMRGLKVLVVDPSSVSRDETFGMLSAWGCKPEVVSNHTEALARMRSAAKEGDPFRLALIEMQLPDVDGEGLGRIIRDDETIGDTPLMLLTNTGSRGDAQRVHEIGFAAYLVRPVTWSHLYDAVVDVMHHAGGHAAGEALPLVTRHSVAEARRGRVRILLVEDNQVNQLVAASVLQRLGFTVVMAANGAEALDAIDREQFDLILMDLQMPEVDGYRATAALRARERGRQRTPIVAMTATATPEERKRCLEAGMDGYLNKPLDLGQLTATVEQFTMNASGQVPEPAEVQPPNLEGFGESAEAPEHAGGAPVQNADTLAADDRPGLDLTDSHGQPRLAPALDTTRLEESCMGIPALRETLLRAFLDDVHPRLERLRAAVQASDVRQVEFEAHGLKGMSATIGATACTEVFGAMEGQTRDGVFDGIVELFARGESEVDRVVQFIHRLDEILRRTS